MPNKSIERQYLRRALELLALQPRGPIEASETPDFFVPLEDRSVGVEITAFYLPECGVPQSHQARMAMQRIAVEQARRQFRSKSAQALYVSVFFVPGRVLTKSRAYEVGGNLANAILGSNLPTNVHEPSVSVSLDLLPPEVASVSVYGSVNTTDELWYPASAGWVAPVEREHVDAEIARKAVHLPKIRAKCEEAWLVIVNDGFRGASPCELSGEARTFGFHSPFDRTLWLDTGCVYELAIPRVPNSSM